MDLNVIVLCFEGYIRGTPKLVIERGRWVYTIEGGSIWIKTAYIDQNTNEPNFKFELLNWKLETLHVNKLKQGNEGVNLFFPFQELIVTGLENTQDPKAKKLAFGLVDKWLQNVYVSYVQSGSKMFEKYDVEQVQLHTF